LPRQRRNPALGLAFRHVGSHEPRGMLCDPLGPFLIADWVPVFGGDRARVRGVSGAEPPPATTSVEPGISARNRPPRTPSRRCSPTLWANSGSISSEDQKRRPSRLENAEAVRRRQVLGAGVSSSTTRSR
jgi:hypothetical protein